MCFDHACKRCCHDVAQFFFHARCGLQSWRLVKKSKDLFFGCYVFCLFVCLFCMCDQLVLVLVWSDAPPSPHSLLSSMDVLLYKVCKVVLSSFCGCVCLKLTPLLCTFLVTHHHTLRRCRCYSSSSSSFFVVCDFFFLSLLWWWWCVSLMCMESAWAHAVTQAQPFVNGLHITRTLNFLKITTYSPRSPVFFFGFWFAFVFFLFSTSHFARKCSLLLYLCSFPSFSFLSLQGSDKDACCCWRSLNSLRQCGVFVFFCVCSLFATK